MSQLRFLTRMFATMFFFVAASMLIFHTAAWAKNVPSTSDFISAKKDHDIGKLKSDPEKALKKYHSVREKFIKSDRGTKKFASLAKKTASAAASLDKVLEKYIKIVEKEYPDKEDFQDFLEEFNDGVDGAIISFASAASKYGKGEKSKIALALKKYINNFKKGVRKIDKDTEKGDFCKIYRGPYRGIGTLMPEFKKHHKKYSSVADKFSDEANFVNEMCQGRVEFDAEKGRYAMETTVEYLEKSLKKILK